MNEADNLLTDISAYGQILTA